MLCYDGKVSLYNYVGSAVLFCLLFLSQYLRNLLVTLWGAWIWIPLVYLCIISFTIKFIYRGNVFQIAVLAAFLGTVFGTGLYVKLFAPHSVEVFGVYMCVMSLFHYGEFFTIALIQPKLVSVDSFVINHSIHYTIAAISSWVEFAVEAYFLPEIKTYTWISNLGLIICIGGEVLRKTAMVTAGSNFNHLVQYEKADDHVLVTTGVYYLCRHPSYVGWFYWSIGTQIILLNPVCIVIYAIASWYFFYQRIMIEEITLLNFFGQQYCDYQQKVGTGLPFIGGYKI